MIDVSNDSKKLVMFIIINITYKLASIGGDLTLKELIR